MHFHASGMFSYLKRLPFVICMLLIFIYEYTSGAYNFTTILRRMKFIKINTNQEVIYPPWSISRFSLQQYLEECCNLSSMFLVFFIITNVIYVLQELIYYNKFCISQLPLQWILRVLLQQFLKEGSDLLIMNYFKIFITTILKRML